jgi:hypothetical protein
VIARGEGDDAAAPLLGAQRQQLVEGTADLERARALEVFTLEKHRESRGIVQRLARHDGRAMNAIAQAPRGGVHVIDGEPHGALVYLPPCRA